jgi:hypothetical protein
MRISVILRAAQRHRRTSILKMRRSYRCLERLIGKGYSILGRTASLRWCCFPNSWLGTPHLIGIALVSALFRAPSNVFDGFDQIVNIARITELEQALQTAWYEKDAEAKATCPTYTVTSTIERRAGCIAATRVVASYRRASRTCQALVEALAAIGREVC